MSNNEEIHKLRVNELDEYYTNEIIPYYESGYANIDPEVLSAIRARAAELTESTNGNAKRRMTALLEGISFAEESNSVMTGDKKPFPDEETLNKYPSRYINFLEKERFIVSYEDLNLLREIVKNRLNAAREYRGWKIPGGSENFWHSKLDKMNEIIERTKSE